MVDSGAKSGSLQHQWTMGPRSPFSDEQRLLQDFSHQVWRLLYFWLRVLFFAAIASPVCAQKESIKFDTSELAIQSNMLLTERELEETAEKSDQSSAVKQQTTLKPVGEKLASTSDDLIPRSQYWIVSSRRAVQSVHQINTGSWHLDGYCCQPGQASRPVGLSELSQDLVPGVPVCIFSHGSFVKWENHWKQSNQAFHNLSSATGHLPLQMIFFSWPSDGPYSHIPQVDVAVRGKRAELNGFHLANLISVIPESCPITLIGHSHGSRVVLAASQLAAGGSVQGYSFTKSVGSSRRLRVILAAGAIDHHWLNPGQRYGYALNRLECLLNLQNQNDLPLAFYPLSRPFARRAVARSGITGRDVSEIGAYNAAKIRQVDVTNRLGDAHYWPDYYSDPQILAAVAPYLVSF